MGDGRIQERSNTPNDNRVGRSDGTTESTLHQEVFERTQSSSGAAKPWRSGYGAVAPSFNPGQHGGAVVPDSVRVDRTPVTPPVSPQLGNGRDTTGSGYLGRNTTPSQESLPAWPPRPVPNVQDRGRLNPDGTPRRSDGTNTPGDADSRKTALAQQVDRTKPLIDRSLQPYTSYWGNIIVGGVAGGLMGPGGPISSGLSRGAKSYLAKTEDIHEWAQKIRENGAPTESTIAKAKYGAASLVDKPASWGQKGAQWWDRNFGIKADHLRGEHKSLKAQDVKLENSIDTIANRLKPEVDRITAKLTSAGQSALSAEEQAVLQKYNYIKGTGQAPPAGMLTAEESALLSQRGLIRGRIASLESELKGMPTGTQSFMQNMARGMFLVAGTQMINDRIDRGLFGKSHHSAGQVIDSIVVPGAMFLPGGFGIKGLLTKGLAIAAGHYLGQKLFGNAIKQSETPGWNRFWQPTGIEAGAVVTTGLIPMQPTSWWVRPLMVGGAMFGTKTLNYFFGEKSRAEMRDQAIKSFVQDKSERSAMSMTRTIEDFKTLGRKTEPHLKWYLGDWLKRPHTDKVNSYRGLAILSVAAGEVRLERGTMVGNNNGKPTSSWLSRLSPFEKKSHEYENILAGYNLDLGGRALADLRLAKLGLDRARQSTKTLADRGESIKQTKVTAAELTDLDTVGKRVDASMAKIYGKHDIPEAMKELQNWIRLNPMPANKVLRQPLTAAIAQHAKGDPRHLAKLYRDLAIVDLAWAGVKIGYNGVGSGKDGAGATSFYKTAVDALYKARELDQKNADLTQLETIALSLGKQIPKSEAAQRKNPTFNPLNVNDGLRRR